LRSLRADITLRPRKPLITLASVDSLRTSLSTRADLTLQTNRTDGTLRAGFAAIAGESAFALGADGAGDARQAVTAIARQRTLLKRDEPCGKTLHAIPDVREGVRLRLFRRWRRRPVLDRSLRHERAPMMPIFA
jgi:hypothetical protein